MIPLMKSVGLLPSSRTYTKLMCIYAKNGHFDRIEKTIDRCRNEKVILGYKDILEVLYDATTNGHTNLVVPLLTISQSYDVSNQDAINIICRLVNKGQEDVAYKVLKTMPRATRTSGQLADSGTFFVNHLVKINRPFAKIKQICEDLEESGLNTNTSFVLLKATLLNGRSDLAIALMHEMLAKGIPVQQQYFWPLFCSSATNEKRAELLAVMQKEFQLLPSIETIRDYVLPNLKGASTEEKMNILLQANVSRSTRIACVAYNCLEENDLKTAAEITRQYRVFLHPNMFRWVLLQAFKNTGDFENYIKFVRNIYDNYHRVQDLRTQKRSQESNPSDASESSDSTHSPFFDKSDILGNIVYDALHQSSDNDRISLLARISDALVKEGLTISKAQIERLTNLVVNELTPKISENLSKLSSGDLQPAPMEHIKFRPSDIRSMKGYQVETIVNYLENQPKSDSEKLNGIKRCLLQKYLNEANLPKYDEILTKIEENDDNFKLAGYLYVELLDLQMKCGDPGAVKTVFDRARQMLPAFYLQPFKCINIALFLVEHNLIEDAAYVIAANTGESSSKKEHLALAQLCWRILNTLVEAGKVDDTNTIYNCLLQHNFVRPTSAILGLLVKVHIVNNDIKIAFNVFEMFCQQFCLTPAKKDLLCAVIEAKDTVALDRITELSTKIHGAENTSFDLFLAYVECGRVRHARNVFESTNFYLLSKRFYAQLNYYLENDQVESLKTVLAATSDCKANSSINRSEIYRYLMMCYCKVNSFDKALDVWVQMQEENVTPSAQFLSYLGRYLKENNIEVPFAIPDEKKIHKKEENSLNWKIKSTI